MTNFKCEKGSFAFKLQHKEKINNSTHSCNLGFTLYVNELVNARVVILFQFGMGHSFMNCGKKFKQS